MSDRRIEKKSAVQTLVFIVAAILEAMKSDAANMVDRH